MGKPTNEELEKALTAAKYLRETGKDGHFLGKTLLNHHYRLGLLEDVLKAARRYLYTGQSSREYRLLVKAIEKAEKASQAPGEHSDLGI